MDKIIVKVLETNLITHNVKQFIVEKPFGYNFVSGQATDVAINKPGLEDELRPFTFTSVNNGQNLEFLIKIYADHKGMTEKLLDVNVGDELIINEVFGAISYKGPGLFIAGGAGITPFISIFRDLKQQEKLAGNKLLFANHTVHDIILKDELTDMLNNNHIDILAHPQLSDIPGRYIDKELLQQHLGDASSYYYICGTDKFTSNMIENLLELGVQNRQVIFEQ